MKCTGLSEDCNIASLTPIIYTYDSLSRLTSETRDFTDTLTDSPTGNGAYELEYTYHVGGALKSYKDPWDKEIAYSNDKTGRLSSVTGTSFAGVTTYANNPQYRAWGALKHLEYGSGRQMDVTYNSRLLATGFVVNKISDTSDKTFDRSYEYYNDGMLKFVDDNLLYKMDRSFTYDHSARNVSAKSGVEASGGTETNMVNLPYRQTYTHDAFGNIPSRTSTMWNYGDWDFSFTFTNNRSSGEGYDFDGRTILDNSTSTYFFYDGGGTMVATSRSEYHETTIASDGDGRELKRANRVWNTTSSNWDAWETTYQVRSSILGRAVTETTATGKKKFTYVIAGGTVVARQGVDASSGEHVSWQHRDASGLSTRSVEASGTSFARFSPEERDALGNNVGMIPNLTPPDRQGNAASMANAFTFERTDLTDCEVDGIMMPCSMAFRGTRGGGARVEYLEANSRLAQSLQHRSGESIAFAFDQDDIGEVDLDTNTVTIRAQPPLIAFVPQPPSWDIQSRPLEANVGTPLKDNTGPVAKFISRRFKECLAKFGAKAARIVQDGIALDYRGFQFIGTLDGKSINVFTRFDKDSVELGLDLKHSRGARDSTPQSGLTLGNYPSNNNIASDVWNNPNYIGIGKFALFIHELGNALAGLRFFNKTDRRTIGDYSWGGHDDAGAVFEACVFGGIVGLRSGRIGTSREFR
ncbi:MAG: hypothetical protein AB7J13_06565 [Pyrinomonadaceae bacterium]